MEEAGVGPPLKPEGPREDPEGEPPEGEGRPEEPYPEDIDEPPLGERLLRALPQAPRPAGGVGPISPRSPFPASGPKVRADDSSQIRRRSPLVRLQTRSRAP